MNILGKLPKPFLALAPMDDVTDTVFRQIVADCALPDLYFTEFVNVDGLQSPGRPKLLKKLQFTDKERPIFAQLWGIKPENFYKTVKEIVDGTLVAETTHLKGRTFQVGGRFGFDGVDLNMGCPVKTVIKNGACAALINNRGLAGEIIEAAREAAHSTRSTKAQGRSEQDRRSTSSGQAGDFPISIKTRVGFSTTDMSWIEFLLSKKLDLLSIHGRTAKQLSNVPADWDLIGLAREMRDSLFPATKIIGNGDVMTRAQAESLAKKYKLDGVMIGRGVFHDPFVFSKVSPWKEYSKKQKLELFTKHIELFAKTWKNGEYKFDSLKKFAKVYINGFEGASELRAKFMATNSTDEALPLL